MENIANEGRGFEGVGEGVNEQNKKYMKAREKENPSLPTSVPSSPKKNPCIYR
jgi:hypothetical protein